mgnify:CR=1 FL=1
MNVFDADVVSCRTDSGKGTNVTYGTMMANGDMYTQSVLHDEAHSSSAYDADYLRKSKPIQLEEEDCEDNTWVTILIFCECRFECLVFNQKMLAVFLSSYSAVDKLLNIVDSKYELVHIAARRSKEMTLTGHFQMPINKYVSKKNIGRALEEVAEGYEGNLNRVKTSSLDTR